MFREDSEFGEGAAPSHLGVAATSAPASIVEAAPAIEEAPPIRDEVAADVLVAVEASWDVEAEKQLKRIPIFVRGKARRNTEAFARERGVAMITLQTLYDARAHYAR
jgi:light-independent protochlorophyllide reductase subunit B